MDRKATAFVEQFSATLFTKWGTQQTKEKELFWLNVPFLHQVLEEGVAKLPKVAVKAHLTRDLTKFVELLQTQLQQKHAQYQSEQQQQHSSSESDDALPLLLNEEDVERSLATAGTTSDLLAKITSVLALDDTAALEIQEHVRNAKKSADFVAIVEQCVHQIRIIRARKHEAEEESERKIAFFMHQIVRCVDATTRAWCTETRSTWACGGSSKRTEEQEKLRALLQSIVASELLANATQTQTQILQPWTVFFRPEESALFRSQDIYKARAGVYGALASLAVSFPVVYDQDDDSEDDDTSGDSDSDSDSNDKTHAKRVKKAKKPNRVDAVVLATHVVRQVVLAAKGHSSSSNAPADWYLAVLGAFHSMAKPTRYVTDEDDEDEDEGLTLAQRKALQDALADLYARAFASSHTLWQQRRGSPLELFHALLCLRQAAECMRVDRKQTVPAVTTATTQLVGVALPAAFNKWMVHVKKMYAGEHAVVQTVMKKLSKHKSEKKMANVLMNDSIVTLPELRILVEQFAIFLDAEKESSHFVVARTPPDDQLPEGAAAANGAAAESEAPVFFVDNDGGKSKKRAAASEQPLAPKTRRQRQQL